MIKPKNEYYGAESSKVYKARTKAQIDSVRQALGEEWLDGQIIYNRKNGYKLPDRLRVASR